MKWFAIIPFIYLLFYFKLPLEFEGVAMNSLWKAAAEVMLKFIFFLIVQRRISSFGLASLAIYHLISNARSWAIVKQIKKEQAEAQNKIVVSA